MGYRSDVEIVFYPDNPEDFAMLKLYVDEQLPDAFTVGEIYPNPLWREGNKYLHLRLESVKWYGGLRKWRSTTDALITGRRYSVPHLNATSSSSVSGRRTEIRKLCTAMGRHSRYASKDQ